MTSSAPLFPTPPQVHFGFYVDYHNTSMRPELTRALLSLLKEKPTLPVFVIGHSMGAALATLCSLDLRVSRCHLQKRLLGRSVL
jgi:pimeloyl-ACP methyl ester carboxylesterase